MTYAKTTDEPDYFAWTPLFRDEEHIVYSDSDTTIFVYENYADYSDALEQVTR